MSDKAEVMPIENVVFVGVCHPVDTQKMVTRIHINPHWNSAKE